SYSNLVPELGLVFFLFPPWPPAATPSAAGVLPSAAVLPPHLCRRCPPSPRQCQAHPPRRSRVGPQPGIRSGLETEICSPPPIPTPSASAAQPARREQHLRIPAPE